MKKLTYITITFLVVIFASCSRKHTDVAKVVECGNNYDMFGSSLEAGKSARLKIVEDIASLNLTETSEITASPVNGKFIVNFKIISLQATPPPKTKGVITGVADNCPAILDNLKLLENSTAQCTVESASRARDLAVNGLSDKVIEQCNCKGTLIDIIRQICPPVEVTPGFYNFPPGVKKPAIYLYPEKPMDVSVSVKVNGSITESIPDYGNGWKVNATPQGLIDGKYDYLFYEAQLKNIELPEEGWVVPFSDLDKWFNRYLPVAGLNKKEISQFKEYWMKEIPENSFYEIKLLETEFLNQNMKLDITPEPDNILRVIFVFKPVEEMKILPAPRIKSFKRTGFTVVEWGGILYDKN